MHRERAGEQIGRFNVHDRRSTVEALASYERIPNDFINKENAN